MTDDKKTHVEVKEPQITARFLADFMAASERAKRTIVQNCRYRSLARVIQHDEAKTAVGRYLRTGDGAALVAKRDELRNRLADSSFDRDLFDHNADYIARFIDAGEKIALPDVELVPPGKPARIIINGVKVSPDIRLRLQRVTRTNKVVVGAVALRYAKNKVLSEETALWHSAFTHGYLRATEIEGVDDVDKALCLTIDVWGGQVHAAPGDAVSRYQNMEAACASIAERWPNVAPPKNAVL